MNLDNKKPGRKPLYVYYIIAAVIIILLNVLLLPAIEGRKVQTTDYSSNLTNFNNLWRNNFHFIANIG